MIDEEGFRQVKFKTRFKRFIRIHQEPSWVERRERRVLHEGLVGWRVVERAEMATALQAVQGSCGTYSREGWRGGRCHMHRLSRVTVHNSG